MTRPAIESLAVSPPRPEIERELYEALKAVLEWIGSTEENDGHRKPYRTAFDALKAYEAALSQASEETGG